MNKGWTKTFWTKNGWNRRI